MDERVMVTLSGKALELAREMITKGSCGTLDEAVERSVALAFASDHEQEQLMASWDDDLIAELNRKIDESEEDVREGRLIAATPAYWERLRDEATQHPEVRVSSAAG